jgi:hypothetical protein
MQTVCRPHTAAHMSAPVQCTNTHSTLHALKSMSPAYNRPHSAEFAAHKISGRGVLGKSHLHNNLKIHLLRHRKDKVSITKTSRSVTFMTVNSVYMDHINTMCGENVNSDR